jgi:uncharacterized membrane protein YtjA (UPF0391 family)
MPRKSLSERIVRTVTESDVSRILDACNVKSYPGFARYDDTVSQWMLMEGWSGYVYSPGMLRWAAIFFVISIVAALFGFGGIAAGAAEIAKVLFFIFLAICVTFLILGLFAANKLRS